MYGRWKTCARNVASAGRSRGVVRMQTREAERSGALVVKAEHISYGYGAKPVVSDFSAAIMRGDKVGIIGSNGSGKTTLLRLLLGGIGAATGNRAFGDTSERHLF